MRAGVSNLTPARTLIGNRSKTTMTIIHLACQGQPGSGRRIALAAIFLLVQVILAGMNAGAWAAESDKLAVTSQGQPGSADAASSGAEPVDLSLVGHGGPVHAIQLNKTKTRALTGSFDYSMMLWDISGDKPKELRRFDAHDGWVKAVKFLPGEKRALAAGGGELRWHRRSSATPIFSFSMNPRTTSIWKGLPR